MDYAALYDRILKKVDHEAYLGYADGVDPAQRAAVSWVHEAVQSADFEPEEVRRKVRDLHAEGQIDRVVMLSTLHVIAACPAIKDYNEAARLVAEQEIASLELGGPNLQPNLASVDRHRGVLAFLMERYEVALEYFSRAFERQRSAGNLANVLATLLRLGDEDEATDLLQQIRRSFPDALIEQLDHLIAVDPDLALLRSVAPHRGRGMMKTPEGLR